MNKKENIRIFRHLLLLILAVNIISFAINSKQMQVSMFEEEKTQKTLAASDEQESDSSEERFYLVAYQAIVPVLQIHFDHQHYFTFELPLLEENEFFSVAEKPLFVSSYFTTLFRQIISPNAP